MVVLRRLDALLEPTKEEVEAEIMESGIDNIDEGVLKDITGLSYFNTSKWTLCLLYTSHTATELPQGSYSWRKGH